MDKRLYSVEFVDDEGDTVIRHQVMVPSEAEDLLERMRTAGVSCSMYDLSGAAPPAVPAVTCGDDREQVEPGPRSCFRRYSAIR